MAGGKHILGKAKRHIFGTAKVGEKGQIVIPKEARTIFQVKPGDTLLILGDEETGMQMPEKENNVVLAFDYCTFVLVRFGSFLQNWLPGRP